MKWPVMFAAGTMAIRLLGAAEWIKISSANFDLLTNGAEQNARQTIENFELACDFFMRFEPSLAGSPPRVTIISFGSFREYRPYAKSDTTLAYFLSNEIDDFIVMSDLETEQTRIAIHEYVHLLVRHSGLSIPLWLNEGMAEVYSTLEKKQGKLLMGGIPNDRAQSLGQNNWMRLDRLLAADSKSPEYNEQKSQEMFYAQSCLLAHMLMLGDGYRARFPSFLQRISATGSTQTAFAEAYGKSIGEIDKELKAYFRQEQINGNAYKVTPVKVEAGAAKPAGEIEVGVILAKLATYAGRRSDARNRLETLAAAHPGTSEVEEALAGIAWSEGDKDTALQHYRVVLATHPEGWKVYLSYARLLDEMGGSIEPRIQAFEEVLDRNPDLPEARMLLGEKLFMAGRLSEALVQLKKVDKAGSNYAFPLYMNLARLSVALRQDDEARAYADAARKAVRNPDENAMVDRIFDQLQENAQAGRPTIRKEPSEPDPDRPILRRNPAKKVRKP